jgi:hypothetical protein
VTAAQPRGPSSRLGVPKAATVTSAPLPAEAATVWTGDRLVVWGGVEWAGEQATILDRGFAWRP